MVATDGMPSNRKDAHGFAKPNVGSRFTKDPIQYVLLRVLSRFYRRRVGTDVVSLPRLARRVGDIDWIVRRFRQIAGFTRIVGRKIN